MVGKRDSRPAVRRHAAGSATNGLAAKSAAGQPDQVTAAVYDEAGRLSASIDARGYATQFEYGATDGGGRAVLVRQRSTRIRIR